MQKAEILCLKVKFCSQCEKIQSTLPVVLGKATLKIYLCCMLKFINIYLIDTFFYESKN
jgi:hypothetical protein